MGSDGLMAIEVEFFGVREVGLGRRRLMVDAQRTMIVREVLQQALRQADASVDPESLLERYLILVDGQHTIYGDGLLTEVRPGQKVSVVAQFGGG